MVLEALRGLEYAHTYVLNDGRPLELVHRDVTPGKHAGVFRWRRED